MPQLANGFDYQADSTPNGRALTFHHENEIAKPNYYGVMLDDGINVEIAPNDHSAIFRFTFPKNQNYGALIFDSVRSGSAQEKFTFKDNIVSGYVLNATGSNNGATVMYIYGTLSNSEFEVRSSATESNKQNLTFDLKNNKTIELKFATSFISQAQAKQNLNMEIIQPNYSFDSLVNHAKLI
jgi:putative alpha-1,2-mannosidase